MSWWNPQSQEISYLGDDVRTVLQRGIGEFLREFLIHLNGERLSLIQEPRIDQVIWQSVEAERRTFHVMTRDRGSLSFSRANGDGSALRDEYGGYWQLQGEPETLDLSIDGDDLHYGAYPNALERLAGGMNHPRSGQVWATAHPGYEFRMTGQSVHHGSGSHGTLHELDSMVPLLIASAVAPLKFATPPRIVDVAGRCADMLGLQP